MYHLLFRGLTQPGTSTDSAFTPLRLKHYIKVAKFDLWMSAEFHLALLSFSLKDEKQRFSSVLLVAQLLAKFLGFISFMPYQTSEAPSREIQEAAIALRSKVYASAKHDGEVF